MSLLSGLFSVLPSYGNKAVDIALYLTGSLAVFLIGSYLYLWQYREYTIPYRNLPGESTTLMSVQSITILIWYRTQAEQLVLGQYQ